MEKVRIDGVGCRVCPRCKKIDMQGMFGLPIKYQTVYYCEKPTYIQYIPEMGVGKLILTHEVIYNLDERRIDCPLELENDVVSRPPDSDSD